MFGQSFSISTSSEFSAFLELMRQMGVEFQTHHQLPKDPWQEIIDSQGYEITSLATWGQAIGSLMFVFSSGAPHWVLKNKNGEPVEQTYGPDGALLFVYDMAQKRVIPRQQINPGTGQVRRTANSLEAMASRYGFPVEHSDSFEAELQIGPKRVCVSWDQSKGGVVAEDSVCQEIEIAKAVGTPMKLVVPALEYETDEFRLAS